MRRVVLDFETYYSSSYSLSKMTTQEYIMHPEFEALMVSYKIDGGPTKLIFEPTKEDLDELRLDECMVVAHNAVFDVGILSMRYNIRPLLIMDTLGAARALGFSSITGCSLDALSKKLSSVIPNIPVKGTAVKRMLGLHLSDLSQAERQEYADYCVVDTDICALIADYLAELLPVREAQFQDMILRCATEPAMKIDGAIVKEALAEVMLRRDTMQERLAHVLGMSMEETMTSIMSNQKFADAITAIAREYMWPVENLLPTKISSTTGKTVYAFAKTDAGMAELLDHPVEDIALLAATRLGLKTTTEHTRLERFLSLSEYPALSIPYNISGAHTHRLSGADSINLQNLPSGRVKGQSNAARRSLIAPDGHLLVSGDSKQIETRVLAYIVNDIQALQDFENGLDPYITMAADIFGTTYEVLKSELESDDPIVAAAAYLKRQIGKSARLGCGFQLGAAGFVNYCKVISRVDISEDQSNEIVYRYRETNPLIVNFWATCKRVLALLEEGKKGYFGGLDGKLFYYDGMDSIAGVRVPSITLPDGLKLHYYNLEWVPSTKFDGLTMVYTTYRGKAALKNGIYGGKLTENLVQALAFAIMKWQGIKLHSDGFKIVSNTHDEYTTVVLEAEAQERENRMRAIMNTAPSWAKGLPLGSDVSHAKSYADC